MFRILLKDFTFTQVAYTRRGYFLCLTQCTTNDKSWQRTLLMLILSQTFISH